MKGYDAETDTSQLISLDSFDEDEKKHTMKETLQQLGRSLQTL